jgi:hypothetical protein
MVTIRHLLPVIPGTGTDLVSFTLTREIGIFPLLSVNRKENTFAMIGNAKGIEIETGIESFREIEMTWTSSVLPPDHILLSPKHRPILLTLTVKRTHLPLPPLKCNPVGIGIEIVAFLYLYPRILH